MRLICGIVHLDGALAQADTLARMVDALTSPGLAPHVARRVEGSAALAVLDFSPHRHVSADRWLAADVRLDRPRAESQLFAFQQDIEIVTHPVVVCNLKSNKPKMRPMRACSNTL